jgi:hypothetical protein
MSVFVFCCVSIDRQRGGGAAGCPLSREIECGHPSLQVKYSVRVRSYPRLGTILQ